MPTLKIEDTELWYECTGEGHSVVFLHAFAVTSAMWLTQVPALSTAGYKVVCIDLRGHGLSSAPPGPYKLTELVLDVHNLIQLLNLGKVCLVGLSTGGRVATRLALDYPDDLSELVLVSAKSEPALDIKTELQELSEIAWGGDVLTAVHTFYDNHYQRLTNADPKLVDKLIDSWRDKSGDGFAGVAIAISEMESVTARIDEIKVPTLAIAGELDPPCHPFIAWYERQISNCKGVIIPGAGHFVNVEQPEIFNHHLIDFLAARNVTDSPGE
jgi:pimeloyl-ACP methyl ester carboxylesterase